MFGAGEAATAVMSRVVGKRWAPYFDARRGCRGVVYSVRVWMVEVWYDMAVTGDVVASGLDLHGMAV